MKSGQAHFSLSAVVNEKSHHILVTLLQSHGQWCEAILTNHRGEQKISTGIQDKVLEEPPVLQCMKMSKCMLKNVAIIHQTTLYTNLNIH